MALWATSLGPKWGPMLYNIRFLPVDALGVPDIGLLGRGLNFRFRSPCRPKQVGRKNSREELMRPTIDS